MLWSFSTQAFTDRSVFRAVAEIAAAGYRGVEILADRPHLLPSEADARAVDRLGGLLAGLGLVPVSLNADTAAGFYGRDFWEPLVEPSLANPDPIARRWRMVQVRRALEIAHELGCPHVSISPGKYVAGTSPERSMSLLTASLQDLARYAEDLKVRVGIGHEPGLLVENSVELAALLRPLPSSWIGASLDFCHLQVSGERIERALDRLGQRIFHVRLADVRGRKHYHHFPGEGDFDISQALQMLAVRGYPHAVTIDLSERSCPSRLAEKSLRYLLGTCSDPNRRWAGMS